MKQLFALFLLLFSLSACATAPGGGKGSCSDGVCVKLTTEGPARLNEPLSMTISVSSEKDQAMTISIDTVPPVVLEEPKSLDNITVKKQQDGNIFWNSMNTKAAQPSTITFKARFNKEALYRLIVTAETNKVRVTDEVIVINSPKGVEVYLSGTPIPTNSGSLPTFVGSTPTFRPSSTPITFPTLPSSWTNTPVVTSTNPAYPPPSRLITATPQNPGKSVITPTLPGYPNPSQ